MRTSDYSRPAVRVLFALAVSMPLVSCAQGTATVPVVAARDGEPVGEVRDRVLSLVNEQRGRNGARPLTRDERLEEAAAYIASYMARTGRLDHAADGTTPAERVKARGYAYCNVSENIGFEYNSRGFATDTLARNFVDGWRNSPTHRANMLDPVVSQTGVAVIRGTKGEYFAVQVFARPAVPGAKGRAACG